MKRYIYIVFLIVSVLGYTQNGINYKAIIKDGSGAVVANQLIQVEFSILENAAIVYTESHIPTTDANGFVLLNIGEGIPVTGTFDTINWANANHYLNVQINTGGGLVDMGTTQFNQVPYAITSGDKVFDKNGDNAFKTNGNIGIGTSNPQEQLHINNSTESSILISTDSNADSSSLRLENGDVANVHTFYKIENTNNVLSIGVDSDVNTGLGYEDMVQINPMGDISTQGSIRLSTGANIAEFSTDATLVDNSDTAVPSEQAVKTYVDNAISRTKTMVIPATAFIANANPAHIRFGANGAYAQKLSGNTSLLAPLLLPEGARVTATTIYVRDMTPIQDLNLEIQILRSSQASTFVQSLFTINTFLTDTELNDSTPYTIFPDFQYWYRVRPTSIWDSDLGIHSIKITYTE